MSTVDVIPTKSSWASAPFASAPAQTPIDPLDSNISDGELLYMMVFGVSVALLVLSFVLKRKP